MPKEALKLKEKSTEQELKNSVLHSTIQPSTSAEPGTCGSQAPHSTPSDDPLLADLNPEQRAAVAHGDGPLLIVAGAGTGKTTVITRRIAWLIANGRAKPDEILALTFTDKASGEMTERIDRLLPLGYTDLWVSTFHAFCQRILERHGLEIGLPGDFRLLGEIDAYLLVRRHFDRFPLDYYRPLGNPTKFIRSLLTHFSRAKDEAVHPREYLAYAQALTLDRDAPTEADDVSRLSELANAYHEYQRLLLEQGCLDLGDLMLYTLELFKKRPAILEKYRKQFRQVIVDEFQDTNWAQYALLKLLAPPDGALMVVGDDDQSIYKFRGASVSNILQFKGDYPSSARIALTANYRSRQNILDLSYGFIQRNNPNRLEARLSAEGSGLSKRLVAEREGEANIAHLRFASLADEASGVADRITAIKEADPEPGRGAAGCNWSDFAILVRSNAGAEEFARELARRGVPHQFLALKGLYGKPIILDAIAWFSLLDDYHESRALFRILSSPVYGIDSTDLVQLTHEARRRAVSLYEVARSHAAIADLAGDTRRMLDRVLADIARASQLARAKSVTELFLSFLHESGYAKRFTADDETGREDVGYVQQFLDRLKRFEAGSNQPTLKHFMEEFALERESGEDGGLRFDPDTGPDMVRIMTVHAAKGLEFRYVFVVSMVDKRFPATERGGDIELPSALTKEVVPEGDVHLEEERRLFYVAMTRAKDGLFLTSAEDYGGKTKKKPSRFLEEVGLNAERGSGEAGKRGSDILITSPRPAPPLHRSTAPPLHDLPAYFSFTQLAAHDACPLQYKYAHVLKVPVFGKPQLSFGRTMHSTLERFMNEIAERAGTAQTTLLAETPASGTIPVSREALLAMYDEAWQDDWYPDKATKEKYREKGRAMLAAFYDRAVAAPPKPLFLEKEFKLKIGGRVIRGKIDRIDQAEGGGAEIIDYKTGTPKKDGKLATEDKRQLLLYQLAVSRLMDLEPKRLTYHYLENGVEVSFLGSEKELTAFEQDVERLIGAIESADFAPKPGMQCKFCDFAEICDYRQ